MKIWEVATPLDGSAHKLKYSLFYGASGKRLVGYDNECGKGDHRHIEDRQERYAFKTVVHDNPVRSVKALAERLGRDYKRVHEDVETLTASGLLLRENGNVSAPYDAITAEMRL